MAVKKQEKKIEEVEVVEVESKVEVTESNVYSNFARWSKIYAILGFISAGFVILGGIFYLIFGVGLLMIAAGVFYIIAYNKVLQASTLVTQLEKSSGKEFKSNTEEVISNLKSYFKIISIINIISIVGSIIFLILGIIFFAAIGASFSDSFNNSIRNETNKPQPVINYKD